MGKRKKVPSKPAISIHATVPLNISGRHARKGFDYQDHVGVALCMQALQDDSITEIWFETEDDLTLIREAEGKVTVEFIQVKYVNRPSRWSVKAICEGVGTSKSLLETSFENDRCAETALFRIVASYDVDNALSVLKLPCNGSFRTASAEKETDLIKLIKKQLPKVKSANGHGTDYWVKNCTWEKWPDNITDLESSNKLKLENLLEKYPKHAY